MSVSRYCGWVLGLCCAFLVVTAGATATDLVRAFRQDTSGQGQAALTLARDAANYYAQRHEALPLPDQLPPLLREPGAVFVSSMDAQGAPRCCMGTLTPREPMLAQEIISNACAAVAHDKRFAPISPAELKKIRLIVSIIGHSEPITDPLTLNPVVDGLAVRGPKETGVVLPGETGSADTMLRWGRIRAGVSARDTVTYSRLDAVRYIESPVH